MIYHTYPMLCERILSPSSISLGDAVINPYRGCAVGCTYCYVQKNKSALKRNQVWGSYVDYKENALERLQIECRNSRPQRVLMGSTTEVYQPCEERYKITRAILSFLMNEGIPVTILTKSPLIIRDIDLLTMQRENIIYLTYSPLPEPVRRVLEPGAVGNEERLQILKVLRQHKVTVHVYVNPLLPYGQDLATYYEETKDSTLFIDFENANIAMLYWEPIQQALQHWSPERARRIDALIAHPSQWDAYWAEERAYIERLSSQYGVKSDIFFHPLKTYFGNQPYHI